MPNPIDYPALVEQRVACDVGEFRINTLERSMMTNIITPTNRARFVLHANYFTKMNKTIRLKIWGSKSGAGAKSLHFSMLKNKSFDKYQALDSIPLGEADCNFYIETVLTAISEYSQKVSSILMLDSSITTINNRATNIKFNEDRIFRIYGECSDETDAIIVYKYEMYLCG